jgi:hypothetical protein
MEKNHYIEGRVGRSLPLSLRGECLDASSEDVGVLRLRRANRFALDSASLRMTVWIWAGFAAVEFMAC